MSLGAGVVSDIYKLEERGTGMGIFFGATLSGLAIAPLIGGAAAQYWSWRNLHYSIAAWGLLEMLLIYISFPETSHPGTIGIEKVTPRRRFHIPCVNPLRSLWLLRSPNLFATTLASSLVLISDYVLLIPLAYTIGVRYGITNEAIIGACFLPNGLGNFLGSPVAGRVSDIVVRKWRVRRKGVWYPEDRLRATWIGGLFMVPLSIGASGLLTAYVSGPIGLSLNLLCLFINGMGVDFVMSPISSYNVDVVHSRSAEISAAHAATRSLIISAATTLVIPSIERIGVAWTNIIAAVLALVGQGIIFLTIRLLAAYVNGPIGLSLHLLCLFFNGMGVDFVLGPISSYNVDVVHSRSAEISAAHTATRSLVISAATTLVIPSIERIGVAWTSIIAAVLALVGQG
ncbi:hypothetical protein AZE42_11055 [Rhizopogon vesiculosus]|uniref:Major facilitator superfamily (MFS) profile domain-containing protein n=1 Tax=Rhizopogon vesiculosus TaxID=180088 RepID=A0A1J8QKH7_9AGAM|nr:hypothetical protein AZE42_11055 [Rhizopogon vesiculosus]